MDSTAQEYVAGHGNEHGDKQVVGNGFNEIYDGPSDNNDNDGVNNGINSPHSGDGNSDRVVNDGDGIGNSDANNRSCRSHLSDGVLEESAEQQR
ncbi:hypothetical protein Dimus_004085 [Dionaea muscipula]